MKGEWRRSLQRVMLAVLAMLVTGICNANDATDFGATRFPVLPELTFNDSPALCLIVLKQAKEAFFSKNPDPVMPQEDRDGFEFIQWNAAESHPGGFYGKTIAVDIDGDNIKEVLIYRAGSIRSADHYTVLIAPPDFTPQGSASNQLSFPVVYDAYAEAKVFRWRTRYYLYDEPVRYEDPSHSETEVKEIQSDGSLKKRCVITTDPRTDRLEELKKIPAINPLLNALKTVGGTGEGECGTLHSGYSHFRAATSAVNRATFRPWAISRHDASFDWYGSYFVFNGRMLSFLTDWGKQDVWSRRESQTFLHYIEPSKQAMSEYLQGQFGFSEKTARASAKDAIENLVAAWIQVPNGYEPEKNDLYSVSRDSLVSALFARDQSQLDTVTSGLSSKTMASKHLSDAVIWPLGLVRLLSTGVDADVSNEYNKTALMTAAHMNRSDAIKILLIHGANPNLATTIPQDSCSFSIGTSDRTALMYAAENSGLKVIDLLLDAGADPKAKDSNGNGVDFYLAKNPRFTAEEKKIGLMELVKRTSGKDDRASFDCAKARSSIEKLICSDEVLRIEDTEVSAAYSRLRKMIGGELVSEQRQWLKVRDQQCSMSDSEQAVGCLQDALAARERYLHNRLSAYE